MRVPFVRPTGELVLRRNAAIHQISFDVDGRCFHVRSAIAGSPRHAGREKNKSPGLYVYLFFFNSMLR